MKKRIRTLCLLLLAAWILLPLCACGKGGNPDEEIHVDGEGWLTHVYRGTPFALPERYSVVGTAADYDPETGVFRCVARILPETVPGEGITFARLEVTEEGIRSEIPLTPAEGTALQTGLYDGDTLYLIENADTEAALRRIDLKTGEEAPALDLAPLFRLSSANFFYIHHLAVDGDGNLCLYSFPEILVLSPEMKVRGSYEAKSMNGFAADGDGNVWAYGHFRELGGNGMGKIKADGSGFETTVSLPAEAQQILFAKGHDLYAVTDSGIAGYDYTEDSRISETGETVVSFLNSDLSISEGNVQALYGPDLFLASERDSEGTVWALYRHAEDIDLGKITAVRIALASTGSAADQVRMKAVEFNKSRAAPDIRIEILDYGPESENGGDDPDAGENRLALEISTGTAKPDLVICPPDGPVMKAGVKHGWFRDLTPYTERPGICRSDNILGCVKRTFTDENGRLFALTNRFMVRSEPIVSTPSVLGEYADRGSWTLSEFLDFAESLPEDTVLMENLTRERAPRILLGTEGYASFIDMAAGTCSFDGGTFARYLDFIASLPSQAEYRAHSPYGLAEMDPADRFPYYRDGKIALASKSLRGLDVFVSLEALFGTKDWVLIGRPSDAGYGVPITPSAVYAVTAEEDRAEAAWEVLEALMTPSRSERILIDMIPAFVSTLEPSLEELENSAFYVQYGGGGMSSRGKEGEWWDGYNSKPGFDAEFTEEDALRLRDLLENRLGVPYREAADEEIAAIADEEISAFLGGVGTSEDCAAKIQSRAGIWIAEHRR